MAERSRKYKKDRPTQIAGKLVYHEQLTAAREQEHNLGEGDRKVLIIHTGGTIGSFRDEEGKYAPRKDQFKAFLHNYPYFSDQSETYFIGCDGFTITPETIFRRKIWYKFHELQTLIDSTNLNISGINVILETIERFYDEFDSFIILHGTDSMSFTASSLSFMIENLKKTIILTGSQIPIPEPRNDAINNLLCALTIAGHYQIPEVLLVFDNFIMRGNRTTKSSASSFRAFTSPNYYPIGKLGLKIKINWELIQSCRPEKPTRFTRLSPDIHTSLLKLTPFSLPVDINCKHLVVESYGIGNIPTEGPYYEWFKANSQKSPEERTVIVNISQVYQSVILNLYATGEMANKLGLIPGSDMTCEAACAKLTYLANLDLPYEELRRRMVLNLRGELTEIEDRHAMKKENYVISCSRMLEKNFTNQSERFKEILLYTVITRLISERSSSASLEHLCSENDIKMDYRFSDRSTLLHQYLKRKKITSESTTYFEFLISQQNVDLNARDDHGATALFYALENNHLEEAARLTEHEAEVAASPRRVFRAIRQNEESLLRKMCEYGDKMLYVNKQRRGVLAYVALVDNQNVYELFRHYLNFSKNPVYLQSKDIYGKTGRDYIQELRGWIID